MIKKPEEAARDKPKMGRPPKKIGKVEFEKLCGLQCTEEEIAGFFDCCVDTIENFCKKTYGKTFSEVYAQKREKGKISLRRSQWKLAERSATMAIFLGKQYLGQRDNLDVGVNLDPSGEAGNALQEAFARLAQGGENDKGGNGEQSD